MTMKGARAYEDVKCYERRNFAEELIVVDAITRGGKFMLAQVVSAFEGVEYIQFPVSLENLTYLVRYGKLDFESCKLILRTDLDYAAYNMAIGRCINTRRSDQTFVHNSVDPQAWLDRANRPDEAALASEFGSSKRLPLFICHDGLCNAGITLRIFPKARFIHIMRDPAALVASWHKQGYGARWGADPKMMAYAFETPYGTVPRFAVDVAKEYCETGELERIIVCISNIMKMERQEYESLPPDLKRRVLLIPFESFVSSPESDLKKIAAFTGKAPHPGLPAILKRERLPRPFSAAQNDELAATLDAGLSPRYRERLAALRVEYRDYWLGEALKSGSRPS